MKARLAFAALAAMFARPQFNDAPAPVEQTRVAEDEGLVSSASATRIRAAFSRLQRFLGGGG